MTLPSVGGPQAAGNITNQQLADLIAMLAKQPQANPSSPYFNSTYFSKLMSLGQGATQQPAPPQENSQVVQPQPPATNYNVVRIVDDPSTIGAQEVAMGVLNLFPSSDGERIYLKAWNNDGLIEPRVYVLQNEVQPDSKTPEDPRIDEMERRILELESAVVKLKKQQASKSAKSSSKPKPKPKPKMEPVPEPEVSGITMDEEEVYDG